MRNELDNMNAEQVEAAFDRDAITIDDMHAWCDRWNKSGKHFCTATVRGNRIELRETEHCEHCGTDHPTDARPGFYCTPCSDPACDLCSLDRKPEGGAS